MLNLENVYDMQYYIKCFSESLRMEPPVQSSTAMMLTEDVDICNVRIRKGDPF